MSAQSAMRVSEEELERRVASLHFFKEIAECDPQQMRAMVKKSRLYALKPGETFLRRGEQDTWLYFLMRGELLVCDPEDHTRVIGVLISGEVFGEISVITSDPRNMDIVVPDHVREVIVFATNFAQLALPGNGGGMSLDTKLILYRQIAQILRWRIELYRHWFPDAELVKIPFRRLAKQDGEDLAEAVESQRQYARFLAIRLQQLNARLGPIPDDLSDPDG